MTDLMTEQEVRTHIKELAAGGPFEALADSLKVSPSYLREVVAGTRKPGPKVLQALGMERVTRYSLKRKKH